MDLTARDIHEKEFHDAWRGYNQEEVDDFLDRIAEVLDRIQRENQSLQTRVKELDQAVSASRDTEEMLKKTLVSAQQAAEEAIATAKAKAGELIGEAEERARKSIEEATERVRTAEAEARRKTLEAEREHLIKRRDLDANIEKLQAVENELKGRIKGFLDQQAKALEGLQDVAPEPAAAPEAEASEGEEASEPGPPESQVAPANENGASPAGNGAGADVAEDASEPDAAGRVVTLPSGEGDQPAAAPEHAEAAHGRRGVRGLFWRDEG
ncbi:MAG: DivIVA domain-containing protein [Actinomycetota bacterium]|nr:DivIVA domain-containing protein [Actinomycetota bacterium]